MQNSGVTYYHWGQQTLRCLALLSALLPTPVGRAVEKSELVGAALLPAEANPKLQWTADWIGLDGIQPAEKPWIQKVEEPASALPDASWIWGAPTKTPGRFFFRREFVLPRDRTLSKATLRTDAVKQFEGFVNGKSVIKSKQSSQAQTKEITQVLRPGQNILGFDVGCKAGAGGLIAALDLEFSDGSTQSIVSDSTWQKLNEPVDGWNKPGPSRPAGEPVTVLGKNGILPWGVITILPKEKVYLPATYVRGDFTLSAKPTRALLYVTALGHIEPRLNGQKVADEFFTPGWSDYRKRLYYRAYDVTDQLHPGANTLGAIVGDGWFCGNIAWTRYKYGRKTRARMELHLFDVDGRETIVATSSAWKASTGPILEGDMQAGETYDAQLEMPGWDQPGFVDTAWKPVVAGAEFEPAIIEGHPAEPVRATQEVPARTVTEPKPGIYVFDLGQNFAGWARLKVQEPAGTPVVLRFAEMLNDDGTIYTANLRGARATDTYVTRGGGLEIWEPRFTYHGFRYVEVTGVKQKPASDMITGIVAHTDLPRTGVFECSDPLLNKIFDITLWSQRSNYFEVPTDCPQRDERLGWCDAIQVFARTGLYNEGAERFLAKWLCDAVDGQSPEGAFRNTAPPIVEGWSPCWADAAVIVPYEIWRTTGRTDAIRTSYEAMKKHVAYYQSVCPKLIAPDQGFGDWLAAGLNTPKSLIGTAYFGHSVDLVSQMAAAIGQTADAAAYSALFGQIKMAFEKEFVKQDGKIGTESLSSYILPLRFNLLSAERRQSANRWLVESAERGTDQVPGYATINQFLPALCDAGRPDLAYRFLQKRTYPSLGFMIDQGATSIWERWNSYSKEGGFGNAGMNSFNHVSNGTVVQWMYSDILGIEPLTPGYEKIQIRARSGGGLTWAKGHYDSVRGRVASAWNIQDGRFVQDVTIPQRSTAIFWLPAQGAEEVTDGKQPATKVPGVKLIKSENLDNRPWALFELQPGIYHFECKMMPNT